MTGNARDASRGKRSSTKRKEKFPEGYFERVQNKAPEDISVVLCRIAAEYLRHLNMPEKEIGEVTDRI